VLLGAPLPVGTFTSSERNPWSVAYNLVFGVEEDTKRPFLGAFGSGALCELSPQQSSFRNYYKLNDIFCLMKDGKIFPKGKIPSSYNQSLDILPIIYETLDLKLLNIIFSLFTSSQPKVLINRDEFINNLGKIFNIFMRDMPSLQYQTTLTYHHFLSLATMDPSFLTLSDSFLKLVGAPPHLNPTISSENIVLSLRRYELYKAIKNPDKIFYAPASIELFKKMQATVDAIDLAFFIAGYSPVGGVLVSNKLGIINPRAIAYALIKECETTRPYLGRDGSGLRPGICQLPVGRDAFTLSDIKEFFKITKQGKIVPCMSPHAFRDGVDLLEISADNLDLNFLNSMFKLLPIADSVRTEKFLNNLERLRAIFIIENPSLQYETNLTPQNFLDLAELESKYLTPSPGFLFLMSQNLNDRALSNWRMIINSFNSEVESFQRISDDLEDTERRQQRDLDGEGSLDYGNDHDKASLEYAPGR